MTKLKSISTREAWMDWLRVSTCFMVMVVHSAEPFYLGGDGALILTRTDAFWAAFFDSFMRACVPLFVIASSYLLFPLRVHPKEFFRRRGVRILIPFVLWTIAYALFRGSPVENFRDLLLNFNYAAGHLWFVYMILGLYLIMPILSPWATKVGKKELLCYLGVWGFTLLIPFIRELAGGPVPVVSGPSGIPMQGTYPLWGEASWNTYGTFYYVSGMVGYLLLGLYFRKFGGHYSWTRTLLEAVPCFLAGFAICFGGFLKRVFASSGGVFPTGGTVDIVTVWEIPWYYDTLGVALMAIAWILLFRKFSFEGAFYRKVMLPVSKASYGMYLAHIFVLGAWSGFFRRGLGIGGEGLLGVWTTPVQILLTAVCTFATVALGAVIIQRIPKVGRFIIG